LHQQWYAWKGREPNDDHYLEGLKIPLSLEPGSAWMYGKSTDWAGQVVEAISGMSLEDYMSKNIWEPLGMRSSTFFLQKRPDLLEKRAELERREPPANHPLPDARPSDESLLRPDVAFGGSGLHSSAGDYAKLLGALVSGDSKILSAKALEEMVRPQLDDPSALQGFVELPIFSPMPDAASGANGGTAIPVNQTLCGAVNLKDIPGKRKAGSIIWRGLSNGYWWLDLKTGIAAVVYLQVVPYGDELTLKLCDEFEKEVYRIWGSE
jgi:CubicO group peptidase (beta-lactamase class C family)